MFSVSGKPFLLHLLELLQYQEINNIILCVAYLGEQIKDFFGDGGGFGIRIRYSEDGGKLLGTGGALRQAQDLLDDYFLIINGDTYLPINYKEVESSFFHRGKKAMMVVYNNEEGTGVRNNVKLDSDLIVIKYEKEKPAPNLKYVEAGALALTRRALGVIEDGSPISLETGLYPALIRQRQLAAYITTQRFYDIGTWEQIEVFRRFLMRGGDDYHPNTV